MYLLLWTTIVSFAGVVGRRAFQIRISAVLIPASPDFANKPKMLRSMDMDMDMAMDMDMDMDTLVVEARRQVFQIAIAAVLISAWPHFTKKPMMLQSMNMHKDMYMDMSRDMDMVAAEVVDRMLTN
jgi:hypothetical protein